MNLKNLWSSKSGPVAEVKELTDQLKIAFQRVRDAQAESTKWHRALDDHVHMMDDMANAAGGMIWRKDASGAYMFANHLLCTDFFGIDSCYDYLERDDEDLIGSYIDRTGNQHTFLANCRLIDNYAQAKGEKCHFVEFGYIGDKGMVLNMIVTPVFQDGAFDGTVGFAFDVSNICNTWASRVERMIEAGTAEKLSDGAFVIKNTAEVCNEAFEAVARPTTK